jgi:hypothetical protein
MTECPNCQTEHPESTLFCEECGSYLLGGAQKETVPLAVTEVTWMERGEGVEALEVEGIFPLGLKLTIPDGGRSVELPLTKGVNIGRLDPTSDSFPDVDLTSDGGLEKGVSRHHTKITRRGNEVFVKDLGSINGTFLNRKKLTPYLPQALKSGDELQLGQLKLRVSFS